jgi:hypothetical protein
MNTSNTMKNPVTLRIEEDDNAWIRKSQQKRRLCADDGSSINGKLDEVLIPEASCSPKPCSMADQVTTGLHPPPCPTEFPRLLHPLIRTSYDMALGDHNKVKISGDFEIHFLQHSYNDENDKTNKKRPRVSFCESMSCIEIPSHRDYAPAVRERLWNSLAEIERHADRNTSEFQADGCNWRNCQEEEDMLKLDDGTLVHSETYWTILEEARFSESFWEEQAMMKEATKFDFW